MPGGKVMTMAAEHSNPNIHGRPGLARAPAGGRLFHPRGHSARTRGLRGGAGRFLDGDRIGAGHDRRRALAAAACLVRPLRVPVGPHRHRRDDGVPQVDGAAACRAGSRPSGLLRPAGRLHAALFCVEPSCRAVYRAGQLHRRSGFRIGDPARRAGDVARSFARHLRDLAGQPRHHGGRRRRRGAAASAGDRHLCAFRAVADHLDIARLRRSRAGAWRLHRACLADASPGSGGLGKAQARRPPVGNHLDQPLRQEAGLRGRSVCMAGARAAPVSAFRPPLLHSFRAQRGRRGPLPDPGGGRLHRSARRCRHRYARRHRWTSRQFRAHRQALRCGAADCRRCWPRARPVDAERSCQPGRRPPCPADLRGP